MKRLLILGAGLVSPPLIRYFLPRRDVRLAIASVDFSKVEAVAAADRDRIRLIETDVADEAAVRRLVREADAVVSILPAPLLPRIARIAVDERRPLVSTSYTSEAVRALDADARAAGVLLLNETGFDPGIDHMTAMRTIARIRSAGGIVAGFTSAAAGLPAPEADTNPWHYKFSWSPRGVIAAAAADARFLRDGKVVEVPGHELQRHTVPCEVPGVGTLEVYPNRDSLTYRDLYRVTAVRDLLRGTMRYRGWTETIAAAAALGWLDRAPREWPRGTTYRDVAPGPINDFAPEVVERLRWAGFLSSEPIDQAVAAPIDIFISRLEKLLRYEPGERDMAILQHSFEADFAGGRRDVKRVGIVAYGDPEGDSAMSRLVGLPAAIAANLILEKRIGLAGVQIPVMPEIYEPVLDELEEYGVKER